MADDPRPLETPRAPDEPPVRDYLLQQIVVGIVVGMLVGGFWPRGGAAVAFLGTLFLEALRMIVVPLVVLSIIVGITGLGDVRKLGRIGRRTIVYYVATTAISVSLGIVLVVLIQPGRGVTVEGAVLDAAMQDKAAAASVGQVLTDMITGLIPENVIKAAAETDVLPLIVFSLFFGAVLTTLGERAAAAIDFLGVMNETVMRMVLVIMRFAPLGIGCLVAGRLAEAGGFGGFWPELRAIGLYAITVILGLALHAFLVLPMFIAFLAKRSVAEYLGHLSTALLTAFSTASSSATLPLTYECTVDKAKVTPRTSSFVLPLGATINMDGTALYEAVAAIFIAEVSGIDLAPVQYVIVFITATLAAVGAAGIPEAGLVTMLIVLKAVGLPLENITLILTIDWFLDRCRTTVNVWGDAVGCAVIDRYEQQDQARDAA